MANVPFPQISRVFTRFLSEIITDGVITIGNDLFGVRARRELVGHHPTECISACVSTGSLPTRKSKSQPYWACITCSENISP